jgi:glyoxalase family protein
MEYKINGLHHITALASDPQRNYDFYTKIMGLRFVKKTVNFDAPDVYHFYFGDENGMPGTILTFFPFPMAARGIRGSGECTTISFAIPKGSMDFWIERLSRFDISFNGPHQRFTDKYIEFSDPDGMHIELTEDDVQHLIGWEFHDLPREFSIRKFFGSTVCLQASESTVNLISDILGFRFYAKEGNCSRYISGQGDREAKLDIRIDTQGLRARQGAGSIHHIAWRTANDATQRQWLNKLRTQGFHPTDIIDRNYFRSIYFREPGGVLFEIATDNPGFMIDEEKNNLGMDLKLPEMYESRREEIKKRLIPISQNNSMVTA